MIRRHGRSLRLLLMIGDALVAMTVLTVISAIRVGGGDAWPGIWSVVPSPVLLLTLYALLWVGLLASQGLYQSRSNWTLEREILRVIRAALLFALITFASLFLLQADAVSRPVLLAVIPIQVVVTLLSRTVIRSVVRAMRRRGRNLRHVLVVGTGATAIDFATRLEERWDLGFVVIGMVGDEPTGARALAGPRVDRSAAVRPPRCHRRRGRRLPGAVRSVPARGDRQPVRRPGQDRPAAARDPDGRPHQRPCRRARWDAGGVAHQRPGPGARSRREAHRRRRRRDRRADHPVAAVPDLRDRHQARGRRAGDLPPVARGPQRPAVRDRQVPDHDHRRRRPAGGAPRAERDRGERRRSRSRTIPASRGSGGSCARRASTSCPSCGTCCAAR